MRERTLINSQFDKHGYIQVYCGDGKGKTTASIGLITRAIGHNWRVLLLQFMKAEHAWHYGEITSFLKSPENIKVKQFGANKIGHFTEQDAREIRIGWGLSKFFLKRKRSFDMLVLDELNHCIKQGVVDIDDAVEALKNKPKDLEVVITGRHAHPKLIEIADLVTTMEPTKHYFDKSVMAREGVEW